MVAKIARLTVQKLGNDLAVRIPMTIARSVDFHLVTPVELAIEKGNLIVRLIDERKMSLKERLENFDPEKHNGICTISP